MGIISNILTTDKRCHLVKTVAVGTMYHDSHVGPNLQVGNFLALYVNTDNIGTDPGRQKPLQAPNCCGLTIVL